MVSSYLWFNNICIPFLIVFTLEQVAVDASGINLFTNCNLSAAICGKHIILN